MMDRYCNKNLFALSHLSPPVRTLLLEGSTFPWQAVTGLPQLLCDTIAQVPHNERIAPGTLPDNAQVYGDDVVIEAGVRIEDFVVIKGPTYLRAGAQLRACAYLRGGVWAEPDTLIGHSTEVKNSLLLAGAKMAHHAYVGDSLLGNDVHLGAGTKIANLKLRKTPISLYLRACDSSQETPAQETPTKKQINTQMRKLGAMMADGSATGCNVVTNPGTLFLKGAIALPGKVVGGVVEKTFLSPNKRR